HFVAFLGKRRFASGTQPHKVRPAHVVIYVIPLSTAVCRAEIALGHEIQQLAVGAEFGLATVIPRIGYGNGLLAIEVEKVDDCKLTGPAGEGVYNPFAIRSERVGTDRTFVSICN